jgi:hypothetical protein
LIHDAASAVVAQFEAALNPLVQVFTINFHSMALVHGLTTCTDYFCVYRRTSMHADMKKALT